MQLFVCKVALLILLVISCIGLISVFDYMVVGSQYRNIYNASLSDKLDRLNTIYEPKIILVGNSNIAFGIDSELIETSLGMPVVNLGLHGGLGNAFHEEIAKQNINKGDIVVVCHSDFSDLDNIPDPELALITYDNQSNIFPVFRKKDYIDLIKAYPTYLRKSYKLWLTDEGNIKKSKPYSRDAFNKYGDVVFKPNELKVKEDYFKKNTVALPKINNICINRLNELCEYCLSQGAFLVIAGYPIARGKYNKYSEEEYVKFQNELIDVLNCPVISDYKNYFYPYDYFYDFSLHLNEKGRQARTRQLISDLNNWIWRTDHNR